MSSQEAGTCPSGRRDSGGGDDDDDDDDDDGIFRGKMS